MECLFLKSWWLIGTVEIGFGGQKDPVLGTEQKLGLDSVSFYLSFVGVAIVCSLLALVL